MSTPANAPADADEWRKNIQQSYRSEEVNNIAKVLASLEPSATPASKLMLASQFEDLMFTAATSLADYRKKITKRLKKMQKNYKANAITSSEVLEERQKDEVVQLQRRLKSLYGEKLELIVQKGRLTVQEYKDKGGPEKSKMLMDHIDTAIGWAADIGAVPVEKAILVSTGMPVRVLNRSSQENFLHLQKVEKDLEKRVDNIRGYVMKLTKPDLFFAERLEEMEQHVLLNVNSRACQTFVAFISEALTNTGIDVQIPPLLSDTTAGTDGLEKDAGVEHIKELIEKIKKITPIPRNKEEEKETMILHLDKIRFACQAFVHYATLNPQNPNTKLQLAGNLRKVHEAVHASVTFLRQVYKEDRSREGTAQSVILEDAWNKQMDYDGLSTEAGAIDTGESSDSISDGEQPSSRRGPKPIAIRSKILFTKRLPPANLLDAMKRKNVTVCGEGTSSYLSMKFGEAFEMSIYFAPLLVTIRAIPDQEDKKKSEKSKFRKTVVDCNVKTWTPSSFGLKTTPIQVAPQVQQGRKRSAEGEVKTKQTVSVMGISADVAYLNPIVAKKLAYASAKATRCLRRCFGEHTGKHNSTSDFEIEISEGNAVLKFLQLARKTYDP